ncbi:MAG: trigger factor [Clostridia bacterium]|nr:trigger factor [Clostridia bacterium]
MKKSRIISLVLCLALAVTAFAGCSKAEEVFDFSAKLAETGMFKDLDFTSIVNLPDYKNFQFAKESLEVAEEDINAEIESILAQFQEAVEFKEGTVEDGDTLNIDYVGSIDGVEFEGGSTGGEGTEVTIGVTNYIDDFLQQLIGHKVGENFDIEVTFPENYGKEELNGKDAIFNITINSIVEYVNPELTDAFVKENFEGVYENVDDMLAKVTEELLNSQKVNDVWKQLTEGAECVELPESVIEFETEVLLNYYKTMAAQYGMEFADYLTAVGVANEEAFIEQSMEQIKANAATTLAIQAFLDAEGIEVTDADLDEYFEGEYDDLIDYYGKPYLKLAIMQDIAMERLMENMK